MSMAPVTSTSTHASRAPEVYAIAGLFMTLTWITSGMRFYVKGLMLKNFGCEDWLAMLAQVFFTLTAAFSLGGISHSMGMHLIDIPAQNLTPAMQYWFAVELTYTVTTGVLKLSIALFLLRIATERSHKIILHVMIAIVFLLTVAYFLFLIFQCSPVDYFWNQFNLEPGSCLSPELVGAMTYTHSGINAAADLVLAALPVVIIVQLQMSPRTKIIVCTILSLGIFACAAVMIRIPYVKILVGNAKDFLYSSTDVVIWSTVEPGLAITAANMATLRPLFSAFLSNTKLWGTTTARGKSSAYGHSKNVSGFSARRGYMRSGSRHDIEVDEMGNPLHDISQNGNSLTTLRAGEKRVGKGHFDSVNFSLDDTVDTAPTYPSATFDRDLVSQRSDEALTAAAKAWGLEIGLQPLASRPQPHAPRASIPTQFASDEAESSTTEWPLSMPKEGIRRTGRTDVRSDVHVTGTIDSPLGMNGMGMRPHQITTGQHAGIQ